MFAYQGVVTHHQCRLTVQYVVEKKEVVIWRKKDKLANYDNDHFFGTF